MNEQQIRDEVRDYYTRAARKGSDGLGHDGVSGASRYDPDALADAPTGAAELSMGCGNPLTMVALGPGDVVLDLGSGGDGGWAECGVGALRRDAYLAMITSVGLVDCSIEYTHDTGPGLHGATVRARRPR